MGLVDRGFIDCRASGLGIFALGYFLPTSVGCVNGVLPVTRKMSLRCTFSRVLGSLKVLDRVFGALKLPNSCPTSHYAQTPVTQHQENDSPNAKIPNVYGTSVNIDESCAPGA
jgi:hypothetical protein